MDLVARAALLDEEDSLATVRDRFTIDDDLLYLDGNSLGRPPASAASAVAAAVDEWQRDLVQGWDTWIDLPAEIGAELAPLIGAASGEVVLCDQTSVNLYKLASAGLSASGRRNIVTDAGNFPSDLYILDALATGAGGELRIAPEDAAPDAIEGLLDDTIGLLSLSHVAYRSGRLHDGPTLTDAAHRHGALALWDLSHSAGAVPVDLTSWGADLAIGCTYKYLNGGPGAPSFLYVPTRLHAELEQPIHGWFGHADQFGFTPTYQPDHSIRRFLVGTPPILSMVAAREGIRLSAEVGVEAIRAKGSSLTSLFIDALTADPVTASIEITTPLDPGERGAHVTIRHQDAFGMSQALRSMGVITDHRAPDLIRFGFAALYTTHAQAVAAASALREVVAARRYLDFPDRRHGVT